MKIKNTTPPKSLEQNKNVPEISDRQSILGFIKQKADIDAKEAYEKKLAKEKVVFQLMNGSSTSIYAEREKQKKILAELPQDHDPKFTLFFQILGKLAGWTEEENKAYHKPHIAAKIINECIYERFTDDVKTHIQNKNPYIKWCMRQHKHYRFLGDDGILMLEEFIDDTITIMEVSDSIYDFRMSHAIKFGTAFQHKLFR